MTPAHKKKKKMETNPCTIIFTSSRTCMHVMCYTIDVVM